MDNIKYPKAVIVKNESSVLLIDKKELVSMTPKGIPSLIGLEATGEFANHAIGLNSCYDWKIATSESGNLILIPTQKRI